MRLKYISGLKKSKIKLQCLTGEERSVFVQILGNLRTTTKFMTKTSVDWERTGTRTSVLAGKRKREDADGR